MKHLNTILTAIIFLLGIILFFQATKIDLAFWNYFDRAPKLEIQNQLQTSLPENLTFQEYLQRGDELASQNILEFAIAHFAKAQSLEPESPIPTLRIASTYFDHGEFSRAVTNAQKVSAKHPTSQTAKLILLKSFLAAGNMDDASRASMSLENPDSEGSYYKGLFAAITNDRESAGKFLHRSVQLADQDPSPANLDWKQKSQTLIDTYHHYDEFRDSPNPHFRALLAEALTANNQPQLALTAAQTLTQDYPEYRDAWIILGHSELALAHPNNAIKSFIKAISLDQTDPAPRYYLALTYLQLEDPDSALTNLQMAEDLGWKDTLSLTEKRALAHIQNQDWQKASSEYEKILAEAGQLTPSFLVQPLFLFFEKINQPEKALAPTKTLTEKYPKSALAHALRGRTFFENGDFDEAKTEFDLSLSLDSTLQEAHLYLGDYFQSHRQKSAALASYKTSFELDPKSPTGILAADRYNSFR